MYVSPKIKIKCVRMREKITEEHNTFDEVGGNVQASDQLRSQKHCSFPCHIPHVATKPMALCQVEEVPPFLMN
jgi:hypothetical protein